MYGSKLDHQGTAGFSPCVHLLEFHFGYLFFDPLPFVSMAPLMSPASIRIPFVKANLLKLNRHEVLPMCSEPPPSLGAAETAIPAGERNGNCPTA